MLCCLRMRVRVKLHGLLRPYHPGPNRSSLLDVELADGATPADAIAALELPRDLARLVFVNDVQATLTQPLRDGDSIGFFSVVVGGSPGVRKHRRGGPPTFMR